MKKITLIATLMLAGMMQAQTVVISSTSFEEEVIEAGVNDGQYTDTGDATVAHDLINNAGETPVDQSGGTEMAVDARYEPYDEPGSGLTDGDFVGVTNFTGTVGAFTDGVQGYQFQDSDGNMIVEFEEIDLTDFENVTVSLDYWIQETGYEYSDGSNSSGNDVIRIFVRDITGSSEIDILNTFGSDINDLGIEGAWINGSASVPAGSTIQLVIEFRSNSGSEALFIDNVLVEGEEVLGVDTQDNNGFSMYPNPANGDVLNIVSATNQTKDVVVYDVLGQRVLQSQVTNSRLNIGALSSGIYLVQVTENGFTSTKKLVVR
ncbi:T9SS type A sorting domain-containing protein [Gilvibacter sp.]|uniref:T9SS type A sorting domain-containing protein n=1 Tax=Gilvibacter sp. TaxID=2729997 RepID=UPI0025C338FE|nr:T9SS type A sorting domain-containing protein [Gilvibacter sp.]NQX76828.1 T9SS type A sorting domain-containing protein [Gilvibacter sp.]